MSGGGDIGLVGRLFEGTVNRALRLDADALRRLSELEGKVILVELAQEGVPLRFYVLPSASGIRLLSGYDGMPHVTISGTASLFFGQLLRGPAVSDGLTVRGDIDLGQRFQRILVALDPDWEEGLARVVGDVPAHQLVRFGRGLRDWALQSLRTLGADSAEYLQEEAFVLAKRERVAEFLREVDRLRADADRLEKRLHRLMSVV